MTKSFDKLIPFRLFHFLYAMFLIRKIVLIPFLFILLGASTYGQSALEFKGPYKVNGYQGDATFTFNIIEGDTILNGDFLLSHSDLNDLIKAKDHSFSFSGKFQSSVPTGTWDFKFGHYHIDQVEGNEVKNNYYSIKVNGSRHHAYGDVFEGKPNGKWIHKVEDIEKSESTGVRFYSSIEFNKGIPYKSFRVENQEMALLGRFLRDGLAHDVWEMYSKESPDISELWHFREGELNKIELKSGDSVKTISVYDTINEEFKVINLDSRYLQIVNLHQQIIGESNVDLEDGVLKLLRENATYYGKIDGILSALGKSEFMPHFKVKVDYNPLNDNEIARLNSIGTRLKSAEEASEDLLNSTQLNILKLADNEVLFQLTVLEELANSRLSVISEIVDAYDEKVLEHVSRENLLPRLCTDGCLSKEIVGRYEIADSIYSKTFTGPNPEQYDFNKDGIEGVEQFTEYITSCVVSIEGELNKKLKINAREQELMELEEELIAEVTSLNDHIDSIRKGAYGSVDDALKNVKSAAKIELSEYSAMDDMSAKPDRARSLTQCMKDMQILSTHLSQLPTRKAEIKETYTDDVWNPFTSTVMSEEVKKRITEAYNEVLIPYFLAEVSKNFLCNRTAELNYLLEKTHARMLELREEDTEKFERKLKRVEDPELVLELLGIELQDEMQQ